MISFLLNTWFKCFQAVFKEDMLQKDIDDLQKRYQVCIIFSGYLLQLSYVQSAVLR